MTGAAAQRLLDQIYPNEQFADVVREFLAVMSMDARPLSLSAGYQPWTLRNALASPSKLTAPMMGRVARAMHHALLMDRIAVAAARALAREPR